MAPSATGSGGGVFDPTRDINFTGAVDVVTLRSTSPTGGIGYGAGAGSAVTQATSKATGVTLNNVCGKITMSGAALSNGVEATFALTNNTITIGDCLIVCHASAGTSGSYAVEASNIANGSCDITVSNVSGGSLSEAIVLNFIVIKGSGS